MRTTKTESIHRDIYICDVCGQEIRELYVKMCQMCKKHLCHKEQKIYGDDIYYDYPTIYCGQCLNIGIPFLKQIDEIKSIAETQEEELRQQWREKCLKK